MPTKDELTRRTVALYKTDNETLTALSKLTGDSVASLVCEMIHNAGPALKSTLEALTLAKNDEETALSKLSDIASSAVDDARQMQIQMDKDIEGRAPK